MNINIKINENNNNGNNMGNAAARALNEIENFRDQELKKIEELKKPIYDRIGDLYVEIDELNKKLEQLVKRENDILDMTFKYEELFNEYAMKEIFK